MGDALLEGQRMAQIEAEGGPSVEEQVRESPSGQFLRWVGAAAAELGAGCLQMPDCLGAAAEAGAAFRTGRAAQQELRVAATAAAEQRVGQLQRSVRSFERLAADHRARAQALRENPTVRPGMQGQSAERIARQQAERAGKLERDAADFDRQAQRAREEIERLRRDMQ